MSDFFFSFDQNYKLSTNFIKILDTKFHENRFNDPQLLQSGRQLKWRSCWSHFLNLALTPMYKLISQHAVRNASYEQKLSLAPVMQTHARVPSGKE